jgi:hypothetical protein
MGLWKRHDDRDQHSAEEDRYGPVRRGVVEPADQGVVGELSAGQRTHHVGKARTQVDIAEQAVTVRAGGAVGDRSLRDHDVGLGQTREKAGEHQHGQVLDRERRGDAGVQHGRRRERCG